MKILIVEDDLQAAEAMERGLTEGGHDCSRAGWGWPRPGPASST
jgi:two-component system OmpR family response regulator